MNISVYIEEQVECVDVVMHKNKNNNNNNNNKNKRGVGEGGEWRDDVHYNTRTCMQGYVICKGHEFRTVRR